MNPPSGTPTGPPEVSEWRQNQWRLVEALSIGTWRWDLASGTVTRDATLMGLLGVSTGEQTARGVDLLEELHPSDREFVRATMHQAIPKGRYVVDYRVIRRDGQVRWLRDRGAVITDAQGQPTGLIGMVMDTTEDASNEERERFFRLAPDMFCVAGMDGYFRRVNAAFMRTLGWSEEELLGQPFFEFVHAEDRAATHGELGRLTRGESTLRFENRYRCKDGGYRWLAWATSPLPAQGLIYAAARDITENKRLEEQARLRADFEQKLIGIVSHDLRAPLGIIHLGTTQLLRRMELEPRVREVVGRIETGVSRCIRLVRDLLDFTQARLGTGIPLDPRPMDLEVLVRQALEEARAGAPERRFELRVRGHPHGQWDPDRLFQVLSNLLSNAVRYSPASTPITLALDDTGPEVTLEVHNQGDPIPPHVQDRLFEPMQRGSAGMDTVHRSVGLGLYIVQHLVQAHGGSVTVRSAQGEGTRITVKLPRAPPPARPGDASR
ncbi:PAS domain-containing sensor histidine kinase [Archangium primigenium]|uniref:PAS domain-containing sensor histidine kinase n=1 Tax=[Archangium] primigenium TaxID=2792470 RepID=UPI00195DC577|nr:PAS domain-containing sensor histidine kinase [Archangium primigenium]MBM7113023.1 PAS domain S-box protein [Archangium primigenium]